MNLQKVMVVEFFHFKFIEFDELIWDMCEIKWSVDSGELPVIQ